LRAKEEPTVSTPVTWDEVENCLKKKKAELLKFRSDKTLERVKKMGDLFAPVEKLKQKLPKKWKL
jgi:bifunctional non-homologous end joining protein LigD